MFTMKTLWILSLCIFCVFPSLLGDNLQFYPGPRDKSRETFQAWFSEFSRLRDQIEAGLDLSIYYDFPEVSWARTSFIQPQVMIHDRFLFDREAGVWTVDKFVEDVTRRYGGVDSVLLWQNYPNIGTDDRNQFDMMEDLPGGLEGLRGAVDRFHHHGVRVLLSYNPWDQGTRSNGMPDYEKLVDQIVATNADGFNGDTLDGVNQTWWDEGLRRDHPVVIEPEILMSNYSFLSYNTMSWGYWTAGAKDAMSRPSDSEVAPFVSMYKAVTRGRHLTHLTERWAQHHEDGIQQAFFNGGGFESWENIWGLWNGITERDGEAIRRTATILRYFGDLIQGGTWIPHAVISDDDNLVFASNFKVKETKESIWLLVNRDVVEDADTEITVDCVGEVSVMIDVYHGQILEDSLCTLGQMTQTINVEANGYGAILMVEMVTEELLEFLDIMSVMTNKQLRSYSDEWSPLPQTMEDPGKYADHIEKTGQRHELETIDVPGGLYNFYTLGNCIEGDRIPTGVDVQFPWETHPRRSHMNIIEMPDMVATKYPITNEDYWNFLQESSWQPEDDHNWLRHWNGSSKYPDGHERKPVTWVSVRDAETFCHYHDMRTPTPWEWQWLGQGATNIMYPWGDTADPALVPEFSSGREMPDPDDVDIHAAGASWCGAEDLVGNVYTWTRVFTDLHTSRAVIRGGSRWRPEGSHWYQPQPDSLGIGPLKGHNTYLLMSDSLDRSGGIGFRCVAEL